MGGLPTSYLDVDNEIIALILAGRIVGKFILSVQIIAWAEGENSAEDRSARKAYLSTSSFA